MGKVENRSHLIDNKFTNNISDEITSGNIYLTFSEHFSEVKREKIDYKSQCVFRDYSKFSTGVFELISLYKIGT